MHVHAWGTEGHSIVATIAQRRLLQNVQHQMLGFIGDRTFASICMIPDKYKSYQLVLYDRRVAVDPTTDITEPATAP